MTAVPTAVAGHKVLRTIGDYELFAKIGEGGMGTVYKGRHRYSGQIVAIKLVPSDVVADPILIKRFQKEFLTAKALDHPNIVRALDYGVTQDEALLVMEFVEGQSLGEKLERDGRMPEAEAILLIAQVAQGLHHAHQRGLIHRDVKPDNVLITPEGQAKLADLGLAKELAATQALTCTGRALGTPHFMAPEQFRSARSADVRSDVFSLAATLYIMVTGQLPFKGTAPLATFMKMLKNDLISPRKLVPGLSDNIDRVIRNALNADPQVRPVSCREFLHEILRRDTATAQASREDTDIDLWYVEYEDKRGKPQVAVATTQHLRRSLHQGLLGDPEKVRVGRHRSGPGVSPSSLPEFKEVAAGPSERSRLTENSSTARNSSGVPLGVPEPAGPLEGGIVSCARDGSIPRSASTPLLERFAWPVFIALALASAVITKLFVFPAK